MRTSFLLIALAACSTPEQGIDNTVLTGTVSIPPVFMEERDPRTANNDTVASAMGLGADEALQLSWRTVIVDGAARDFDPDDDELYGDPDYYTFTPAADGTLTLTLDHLLAAARPAPRGPAWLDGDTGAPSDTGDTGAPADTGDTGVDTGSDDTGSDDTGSDDTGSVDTGATDTADTGGDTADTGGDTGEDPPPVDPVVFVIEVYDLASYDPDTGAGLVLSTTTDGSSGAFSTTLDVTGGADYLLLVAGVVAPTPDDSVPYTLSLGGADPTDAGVLVGAYVGSDASVAEAPLGGATPVGWTYDMASHTWTGSFTIYGIRALTMPVDTDTADTAGPAGDPVAIEGAASVFVRAATVTSLNASPSAGALYSTASVEVALNGGAVDMSEPVVMDAVFPKVIGKEVVESGDSFAELDANYALVPDTLVAQDIGVASGLGFVDVFDGTISFDPAVGGWTGNDADVFAFTVPEPMAVKMVAGWADAAADIDFGIFGTYGEYGIIDWFSSFGDSYCLTGANPEVCETVLPLEPDVQYYLVALGYLGTDEEPYHVELEWLAP